jgi:MoaA/NifB/PqqE/SkfB family radical SAM enzyme
LIEPGKTQKIQAVKMAAKKDGSISRRVDRHTHVPRKKFVLYPPFPDAIKIELTARCNYECSYCASKRSLRPIGDIDKNFLYRILKEAKSIGVKEIGMFLLGESFLIEELPEYIRYAKEEAGIEYVFITANGSFCTPRRLIPVIKAGLDSLKFSINAGTRERYKQMHGVDCFEEVISNIKWLHEYKKNKLKKPRTCVSSIFINEYEEELKGLRKMISQYVDEFYYLPLYNQAGHIGGKEFSKIVGNPGRLENMVPPVPCWALFNAAKITWNGRLTACCFDHDTRFEIADLNKVSLLEAWHHPKFVKLRQQHLTKDLKGSLCAKCLGLTQESLNN